MRGKREVSWLWTMMVAVTGVCGAQQLGQVGNVQVGPAFCGTAQMNLARPYTCVEVTVRCDDPATPALEAEDRPVMLRVTTPPPGTPIKGTVVLGLGGGGQGFFESAGLSNGAPAVAMLDSLNVAGYRTIQRAWGVGPGGGPGGWINGSTSLERSACRYATLLTWIHGRPQLHDLASQAFCAVGQSGGSTEIGFALSTFDLDDRLDLAVLTGGPPHGRMDGGCNASTNWQSICNQNLESLGVCPQQGPNQHTCLYSSQSITQNVDSAFELNPPPDDTPCVNADTPVLRANSVLSPGADVDHPQTRVEFLVGENDCGSGPGIGSPYILSVLGQSTGPSGFAVLPGVSHTVPAFASGAAAIEALITDPDGCVLRH